MRKAVYYHLTSYFTTYVSVEDSESNYLINVPLIIFDYSN